MLRYAITYLFIGILMAMLTGLAGFHSDRYRNSEKLNELIYQNEIKSYDAYQALWESELKDPNFRSFIEEWKSTQKDAMTDVGGGKGANSKALKDGSNAFGVRNLSVLEKRYMAEAAARQKANQIVKQVVGGKEWVGPAFLAAPKVLLYKDFDVGETYNLKFTLTNVSYTFNMFRQCPLPDHVLALHFFILDMFCFFCCCIFCIFIFFLVLRVLDA